MFIFSGTYTFQVHEHANDVYIYSKKCFAFLMDKSHVSICVVKYVGYPDIKKKKCYLMDAGMNM